MKNTGLSVRLRKAHIATALVLGLTSYSAAAVEVITGNEYAPYTDEKLPGRGFATELVEAVFKNISETPTIRFMPWKRGYEATLAGEALATFPYVKNPDREAVMTFSDPLYFDISRVFSAKDKPVAFTGDESLAGKTICNPTGYVIYPGIRAGIDAKTIRLQEPGDMATCLKFLELGRADFVISSLPVIRAITGDGLTEKLTWAEKPYRENASFMIVGKKTAGGTEFLQKFNNGLAAYRESTAYAALVKKHGLDGAVK